MSTWGDLKALREAGYTPAMKLAVFASNTSHRHLRWTLIELGAMVIDQGDEPVPEALLADLDVLLLPECCTDAQELALRLQQCATPPARCRVWCDCVQRLNVFVPPQCERVS